MTEADARLYPETVDLACVLVRDQTYALDVTAVREIVRFAPLTPLPDAPALIEGVLDLRGTVLPVVDLARVLARGRSDGGLRARIVVLEVDRLVLGLWVDAATDVLSVERAALYEDTFEDEFDRAEAEGTEGARLVAYSAARKESRQ